MEPPVTPKKKIVHEWKSSIPTPPPTDLANKIRPFSQTPKKPLTYGPLVLRKRKEPPIDVEVEVIPSSKKLKTSTETESVPIVKKAKPPTVIKIVGAHEDRFYANIEQNCDNIVKYHQRMEWLEEQWKEPDFYAPPADNPDFTKWYAEMYRWDLQSEALAEHMKKVIDDEEEFAKLMAWASYYRGKELFFAKGIREWGIKPDVNTYLYGKKNHRQLKLLPIVVGVEPIKTIKVEHEGDYFKTLDEIPVADKMEL